MARQDNRQKNIRGEYFRIVRKSPNVGNSNFPATVRRVTCVTSGLVSFC